MTAAVTLAALLLTPTTPAGATTPEAAAPTTQHAEPQHAEPRRTDPQRIGITRFCRTYRAGPAISCTRGHARRAGERARYGARDDFARYDEWYPMLRSRVGGCDSLRMTFWGGRNLAKLQVVTTGGTTTVGALGDNPKFVEVDLEGGPFRVLGRVEPLGRIYLAGSARCAVE